MFTTVICINNQMNWLQIINDLLQMNKSNSLILSPSWMLDL